MFFGMIFDAHKFTIFLHNLFPQQRLYLLFKTTKQQEPSFYRENNPKIFFKTKKN